MVLRGNTFNIINSTVGSNISITGIANPTVGLYISLFNDTSNSITLKNESSESLSANRFYLPGLTDLIIQQQCMVSLIYLENTANGSRWTCVSHT